MVMTVSMFIAMIVSVLMCVCGVSIGFGGGKFGSSLHSVSMVVHNTRLHNTLSLGRDKDLDGVDSSKICGKDLGPGVQGLDDLMGYDGMLCDS